MKPFLTLVTLITTVVVLHAERSIAVAYVHPQSKEILSQNHGKVPESLRGEYRLLYEFNSGTSAEKKPLENGLLVAKVNLVDQKDFIGHETISTVWGNLGGILHLRIGSRDKLIEFLTKETKGSIALVIDNAWVFYDTGLENITPQKGFIAIPVLDKLDEERFELLIAGKRGKDLGGDFGKFPDTN